VIFESYYLLFFLFLLRVFIVTKMESVVLDLIG